MATKSDAVALPGARAVARHVRISPTKARRVVDLVRGLPAKEALTVLQVRPPGGERAGLQGARQRRGERGEQRAARPGLAAGAGGLRRRGPHAQAVPSAGAGPGVPDPQADVPHHVRGGERRAGPAGPGQDAAPAQEGGRGEPEAVDTETDRLEATPTVEAVEGEVEAPAPKKKATKKAAKAAAGERPRPTAMSRPRRPTRSRPRRPPRRPAKKATKPDESGEEESE